MKYLYCVFFYFFCISFIYLSHFSAPSGFFQKKIWQKIVLSKISNLKGEDILKVEDILSDTGWYWSHQWWIYKCCLCYLGFFKNFAKKCVFEDFQQYVSIIYLVSRRSPNLLGVFHNNNYDFAKFCNSLYLSSNFGNLWLIHNIIFILSWFNIGTFSKIFPTVYN